MAGFPPKKNTTFTFHTALISQADVNIFKTSPTLAAGDITVSIDGGNYANIGTLPTQIQTTGVLPVALTSGEMNGNVISVLFHDAAGSEWQDQLVMILTDTHQISGVALVDDAITSAKFDESTAFPIKADDSGSTYIARTGADSDTLEVLSDEIDVVVAAIAGIGSGTGAALNFAADDDSVDGAIVGAPVFAPLVPFVGVQTSGTFASTAADDGTKHQIDDATNEIDIIYQFTIGAGRNAAKVVFTGYMGTGTGDTCVVKAYNFVTTAWDTRTTIIGQTGSTNITRDITLLSAHTGTGAYAGKVYIRFDSTASNQVLYVDSLICQAQNLGQTIGYQDGLIWVDTAGSNANTTPFVDGTADNPVNSIAAAYTLAAATGLKGIRFLAGSSVTLTQSAAKWRFVGAATIALNGQSIADAVFRDSYTISGTSTGDDAEFINCGIGTATIAHAYFIGCRFKGTLTMVAANEYFIISGYDAISSGATTFVFAAAAELMVRDWHGGLQLNGMAAGDTAIIDGAGRLVIDGSCTGGAITIRGHFAEATGAAAFLLAGGTITDTARWAEDQTMTWNASWDAEVQSEATDALNAYDPPTATEMTAAFTEIKGATWSATTDTIEHIRNKETDIEGKIDDTYDDLGDVRTVVDAILVDTGTTLDTKINTIDDYLDTEIAAIKAKTDLIEASTTIDITIVSAVTGSTITIKRGDTLSADVNGMGSIASYVSLDFVVKSDSDELDTEALIWIRKNASGLSDGLLYINGAAATTATNGSITIDDASAGDITITLAASETDGLDAGSYQYDIQMITATAVSTLVNGICNITRDVARAVA